MINGSISTESNPIVVAKFAMKMAAACDLGLPSVTVTGNEAQIPYLYKDLIEALSTVGNPQQTTTGGIYSQTGIDLVSFVFGTQKLDTAEIVQISKLWRILVGI